MTTNNKFLYFNTTATDTDADGGVQDGAITIPASSVVAFDVRAAGSIVIMTKEAVQTDTTDVTLVKPTTVDPRAIIEEIVNEITFSKDAMIVVADDNTSEYLHDDIESIQGISAATYSNPTITLGSSVKSFISGANAGGGGIHVQQSNVGEFNSELITTIFIDLAYSGSESNSSGTEDDVIGINPGSGAGANAYFTQVTTATNGIVYAGEIICVEQPTSGTKDINVVANDAQLDEDEDGETGNFHVLVETNDNYELAMKKEFVIPDGGIQNDYLYLTAGDTTANTYDAGKFLIRLYGAKATGL